MTVHPAKTRISLGIHPVWSESSLSAWRNLGSLATHWVQAKTLIRLGGHPGWFESSLGSSHFVGFIMRWLEWASSRENLSSGVCNQVRLKLSCSASEASESHEIANIENRDIILSMQRTTKALIRLRRLICAFVVRMWHKQVFSYKWASSQENLSLGVCDQVWLKSSCSASEAS